MLLDEIGIESILYYLWPALYMYNVLWHSAQNRVMLCFAPLSGTPEPATSRSDLIERLQQHLGTVSPQSWVGEF